MLRILTAIFLCVAGPFAHAAGLVSWQSGHDRDHPLVGTVWSGDGRTASFESLAVRAAEADFVLIGEIHTNPDHHLLQARLLAHLTESGRRPAVVFEMINRRYQQAVKRFQMAGNADASLLGQLVDWESRGWPAWDIYQPIAEAALAAGLPIAAGDLDKDTVQSIAKSGASALPEPERDRFGLDVALPPALSLKLRDVLRRSHCNLLPDSAFDAMMAVQRARDGSMAAAMIDSGRDRGAVLIAGAGHTRNDFGVPMVLDRLDPGQSALSISIIEVEAGSAGFSDYSDADGTLPYDFVVFTPRFENKDHCAELRKAFGKHDGQSSEK